MGKINFINKKIRLIITNSDKGRIMVEINIRETIKLKNQPLEIEQDLTQKTFQH